MNEDHKDTLPLIYNSLSSSEQKVLELIEKDQILEAKKREHKKNYSKSEEDKVMVKATIPLVADFLGTTENRVRELYDINGFERSKNQRKKE